MRMLLLGLSLVLAPWVATAETITLTIYSEPAGGLVHANRPIAFMGQAPAALTYTVPTGECWTTTPIVVTWSSGATAVDTFTLCANVGTRQTRIVFRPDAAPNYNQDREVAVRLARESATTPRARTAAAEANRLAGALGLFVARQAAARRAERAATSPYVSGGPYVGGEWCPWQSERVDGLNKICLYACPSGATATNARSYDLCPLSISR